MSLSAQQRYYMKHKALYYFYEKDYSYSDIAKMLGISRVTLNRLIAEAKEEGMVKIQIIDTQNLGRILELEDKIKNRYGLNYVRIVDVDSDSDERVFEALAHDGAQLLERMLRSGQKIGLGWGRTLASLVKKLPENPMIKDMEVYTFMGGDCSEAKFQPNLIAQDFVACCKGRTYIINAPFICHSELLCAELKKEPSIAHVLETAKNLDIALVGIGSFPTRERLQKSYYQLPDELADEIQQAGAVGDICGIFLDKNGEICQTKASNRIVSIDIRDLRECKHVLAVAGGEEKHQAIVAAIKGGYINVLVTDLKTAEKMLEYDE